MENELSPYYEEALERLETIILFAEELDVKFKTIKSENYLEELRVRVMKEFEQELISVVSEINLTANG